MLDEASARSQSPRSIDQHGDPISRVRLHRGDRVTVEVQRHGDGGVPQPLLNDLRVDAGRQREGRVRVPQVMEPDARQPELAHICSRIRSRCRGQAACRSRGQTAGRRPGPPASTPAAPPPVAVDCHAPSSLAGALADSGGARRTRRDGRAAGWSDPCPETARTGRHGTTRYPHGAVADLKVGGSTPLAPTSLTHFPVLGLTGSFRVTTTPLLTAKEMDAGVKKMPAYRAAGT